MGSPAWLLTGNASTNSATDFVGTTDGQSLIIKTSGTERIRVDANGKVGIAATDPGALLSLGGDFGIKQAINDGSGLADYNCGLGTDLTVGAANSFDLFMAYGDPLNPSGNTSLNVVVPTAPWPYTAYQALLTVRGNGNVGIGTTQPNFSLHMPAGKVLRIEGGTSASDSENYFSFGGNGTFGVDAPNVPNGRFVVLNSGDVGIGTPTPAAALDVGNGLLHVGGTTSPTTTAQGAYLGWNALTGGTGETDFINNQGAGSGGFAFMNTPSSGSPITTLMVITGGGNVGIGTATPAASARLTVSFPFADSVSPDAASVIGQLTNGGVGPLTSAGVIGQVTNVAHLRANTQTAGVRGINDEGHGVQGQSDSHVGIEGTSNSGTAVYGETQSGVGIWGVANNGPWAGLFEGNVHVTGPLLKSGGGFRIDHPAEPANKYLNHSFVESSEMKNVYDGIAQMDARGEANVTLPEWFEQLNREFRYQLTAIGAPAPQLHVAEEIAQGSFRIAGGAAGQRISWQVTGIRKDRWAQAHSFAVEEEKPDVERGYHLHPELFGQPKERNVIAARFPKMYKMQRKA